MRRFFKINSWRDVARISIAFVLVAEIASLAFGEAAARLIGQPTDWKHYLLNIVIPLILTPLIVVVSRELTQVPGRALERPQCLACRTAVSLVRRIELAFGLGDLGARGSKRGLTPTMGIGRLDRRLR